VVVASDLAVKNPDELQACMMPARLAVIFSGAKPAAENTDAMNFDVLCGVALKIID
jgi:hypothetical protein